MVINPADPKGLEAAVPRPQTNANLHVSPTVVIQVDAARQIKINQDPVLGRELGRRLQETFKSRAERVAFVKADPGQEFRDVSRVIAIAKGGYRQRRAD